MSDRSEYWKKRWAKQKAEETTPDRSEYWKKRWKEKSESTSESKSKSKKSKPKKNRRRYYQEYNKSHPERLERGYTKGYVNGNVSEGVKEKIPNYPGGCILVLRDGYYIDKMGWMRNLNPLTDAITVREQQWHDNDWEESSWNY
jgi:hypothetical protein